MAGRAVLASALLSALAAAGCSYPTSTTPYPGLCAEMFVAAWSPYPNQVDVPTNPTVVVTFSDYPDPDTVGEPTMLLTTGVYRVPEVYRVDLARKAVTMSPGGLNSQLGYTITVSQGVASLAGCTGTFAQRSFTTGDGSANVPTPDVPAFGEVQAIFATSCAGVNCHADLAGGCLPAPAAGLSLCAPEARDALVQVPSREVASLALVAPLDSARSYLVRKLLPASAGGGPVPGTLGQREPPGPPLTPDQIETIVNWIDGGALP